MFVCVCLCVCLCLRVCADVCVCLVHVCVCCTFVGKNQGIGILTFLCEHLNILCVCACCACFFVELQIANISHSQPEAQIQSGLANTRCILTYVLLILSSPCNLVNGGKEVNKRMKARQPLKSRHVTPHTRKGVTPARRRKVFKRPCGIATDDMASTGSSKLQHKSPLGNAIRSYI